MSKKVRPKEKIQAPQAIAQPSKIPEGYLIKDNLQESKSNITWRVILLSLWCGLTVKIFVGFVRQFIIDFEFDNFLSALILAPFLMLSGRFLIEEIQKIYRMFWVKTGELVLPTYPLRQGEIYHVKYRRALRRGRTCGSTKISASWINYRYRRSTNTVTDIYELDRTELFDQTVMAGVDQIEYEAQITVPENMFFSINHPSRNQAQIRWGLQITVRIPYVAKDTSHFVLNILPAS